MRFILTRTGKMFDPFNIDPSKVSIVDIAWALSGEGRFTNHCVTTYTVGQHCILGTRYLKNKHPKNICYNFLMHDITEAYLKDLPFMIKPSLLDYKTLENSLSMLLSKIFLNDLNCSVTHQIDRSIAIDEIKSLMYYKHNEEYKKFLEERPEKELGIKVIPWTRKGVFIQFINEYTLLKPEAAPEVNMQEFDLVMERLV